MKSQIEPSEIASVERSWPSESATSAAVPAPLAVAGRDGAQQRERLEIDPDQLQLRDPARLDVVVDRLAVRSRENDAARQRPGVVDRLADHVVVEHRLIDRDRERLVGAEPHRVAELAIVFDSLDVQCSDADAVRADAEANATARQLVLGEEPVERLAERRHVTNLAGDDDAGRQRCPRELHAASPIRC